METVMMMDTWVDADGVWRCGRSDERPGAVEDDSGVETVGRSLFASEMSKEVGDEDPGREVVQGADVSRFVPVEAGSVFGSYKTFKTFTIREVR